MKNKILKILSNPKIIIPLIAIIGIVVVVFEYNNIGKAPIVNIISDTPSLSVATLGSRVDLSFPKSGRVESVEVKNGQVVYKGEILARLSASDQEGAISQAKGALDLAEADYASLNSQYASAKKQQDLIVLNAYRNLLNGTPEAIPSDGTSDYIAPTISGNYNLDKEGIIKIKFYYSVGGVSFNVSGLASGSGSCNTITSQPLGDSGLYIKCSTTINIADWNIEIPNTKSSSYLANYNAYQLAQENRDKILSDLGTTIGNAAGDMSVEKAKVDQAQGAYEAALGAYQNNLIIAPVSGVISFMDKDLIVGQSVTPNKIVISITAK